MNFFAEIDKDKCQGCGECVDICAIAGFDLVEEGGKKYAVFRAAPGDCIACISCESTCAEGAITVKES